MNIATINWPVIKLLVAKDWVLFQKQLAAYVTAAIFALCLLGMAKAWSFYLGSLLLIVVLVAAACFSISTALLNERKAQTLAFIMSLPVSPLDFYLAKLLGNLITFFVPYLIMLAGTLLVILYTPLPDGLVVFSSLVFGYVALAYAVSLSVAMAVESEGWNTFVMIGSNVLINPFIMALGQIRGISAFVETENIVWNAPAVGILAVQISMSLMVLGFTGWIHCRKQSFY